MNYKKVIKQRTSWYSIHVCAWPEFNCKLRIIWPVVCAVYLNLGGALPGTWIKPTRARSLSREHRHTHAEYAYKQTDEHQGDERLTIQTYNVVTPSNEIMALDSWLHRDSFESMIWSEFINKWNSASYGSNNEEDRLLIFCASQSRRILSTFQRSVRPDDDSKYD